MTVEPADTVRTKDASARLPPHLRRQLGRTADTRAVSELLRRAALSTVCEEARCPNRGECFAHGTATFMILGDRCTRRCSFCDVETGRPLPVDEHEPWRLADTARTLGLRYVVITSVDRDDLPDEGAGHFAACIRAVRARVPGARVEVLTPDFHARPELLDVVLGAGPDVFNHNLETVPRLYRAVRPQSRWEHTTETLRGAARRGAVTKSGIMLGLGERDDEVRDVLSLMRDLGVRIATLGQYLQPSRHHAPVERYLQPEHFDALAAFGRGLGLEVFAGPFVRSSYHAGEVAARAAPRRSLPVLP